MKTTLFLFFILCHLTVMGQTKTDEVSAFGKSLDTIQFKQMELDKKLRQLATTSNKNRHDIHALEKCSKSLYESIDSLKFVCDSLQKIQTGDRTAIKGKIQETNNTLALTQSIVKNRTFWGAVIIVAILFALLLLSYYLTKRIKRGRFSIDEVRKAQEAMQAAQTKMQEEGIKLDNRLLEIAEQQMKTSAVNKASTDVDHSLALKVADEIVRIELNLSRMDTSIKGYKQLAKAVQRIKDNFRANGYEIVDMLGKPYNEGMRVKASFVVDETLPDGTQRITSIAKPQVNYNGEMIQKAEVTISQNI